MASRAIAARNFPSVPSRIVVGVVAKGSGASMPVTRAYRRESDSVLTPGSVQINNQLPSTHDDIDF